MVDERRDSAGNERRDGTPLESVGDEEFLAMAKEAFDEAGGRGTYTATSTPPQAIGAYRILSVLGKGAMGTVYEAEQQHPRRPVALKVVRGGRYVDEHYIRLFQREVQTLARVTHPHIAAIYESGCTEDGQHFFAMELVRGARLNEYVRANELGLRARLKLFCSICDAINYAHQRGVIHRDLKPDNILIDAKGHPKVLDFGLARITDADVTLATSITEMGKPMGTLPYMSPEQARGSINEIDVRSDVYSLGVILYELLTGRHPYDVARRPLPEAARVICEEEPHKPSTINRSLRGDLETILRKALEKDPARRYQSAAALGDDVERFLGNQPVLARPPGSIYQLRKLVARHKAPSVFVVLLFVLVMGFGIWMRVLYRAEWVQRRAAEENAATAGRVSDFLVSLFARPDPYGPSDQPTTPRGILDQGAERIEADLENEPAIQATMMDAMGAAYRGLGLYSPASELLEKALRVRRDLFGETHPAVAESLNDLARVLRAQGDYVTARAHVEEAVAIHRKLLGEEGRELAEYLSVMGWTLKNEGDYSAAEPLFREALEMQRKFLGPENVEVSKTVGHLGDLLRIRGKYKEAGLLVREALEMRTRLRGEDDLLVADALSSLGGVLRGTGDYKGAEDLMRRALAALRTTLDDDHPHVATTLIWLGVVVRDQGDLAGAEQYLRKALALYGGRLDPNHPHIAACKGFLAWLLFDKGDYAEAELLFKEALAVCRVRLGEKHARVGRAMLGLARVRLARGDPEGAEPLLREVVAIFRGSFSDDHWSTASAESALGSCLTALGRYTEAEPLVLQSHSNMERIRGPRDRYVLEALQGVITLYEAWGKPDEAAAWRGKLVADGKSESSDP